MSVGLRLDEREFVAWRLQRERIDVRRVRACAAVVDDIPAARRLAADEEINFAYCGGKLVFFGDRASVAASAFRVPLHSLLPGSQLPPADPVVRQLLGLMVDQLVDRVEIRELVYLVLPDRTERDDPAPARTTRFLQQLLELRGYEAKVTNPALASGLALLGPYGLCGLSLVIGRSRIDASLIQGGREVATASFEPEFTHQSLFDSAAACPDSATDFPLGRQLQAIGDELLCRLPLGPLLQVRSLAVAGELCSTERQREQLRSAILEQPWQFRPADLVFAQPADDPILRGALLLAELDAQPERLAA